MPRAAKKTEHAPESGGIDELSIERINRWMASLPKQHITLRIEAAELVVIDALAGELGLSRTEILGQMIAKAVRAEVLPENGRKEYTPFIQPDVLRNRITRKEDE